MGWSSSLTHSLGSIAGGAIGGIFGGAGGAAVGSSLGSLIGPSQERMDRRNYNYQLRQSKAMWDLQNAYNSPSAQMSRLKEAGLNPMLVYGSGNVTGNASSSIDMPTLGQSDVMANANHFTNTMGEMASNSFKQNMQEQRIAAQQSMQNNELDLSIKQAQLEYLQLRNKGLTGPHGNVKNRPITLGEAKTLHNILDDASNPSDIKGSSIWTALPRIIENIVFYASDKLGGAYYRDYNNQGEPHKELF